MLSNLQQYQGFPGKEKVVILLGALPDRDIKQLETTIYAEGYNNIYFLLAPWLVVPPPDSQSILLDIQSIKEITNLNQDKWVLLLGSHRTYNIFKQLTNV